MRTDLARLDAALSAGAPFYPWEPGLVAWFAAVTDPDRGVTGLGIVFSDGRYRTAGRLAERLSQIDPPGDAILAALFAAHLAEARHAPSLSLRSHHDRPLALLRGEAAPETVTEQVLCCTAAHVGQLAVETIPAGDNAAALALANAALAWDGPDA